MNPFITALNSHQAKIVYAMVNGVAFKICDARTNFKCMYEVYSHEGDDIGMFTIHDVESMIHLAKRAGYGYYKMSALIGKDGQQLAPAGLTFYNYGPGFGTWMPGATVGIPDVEAVMYAVKSAA